MQWALAQYKKHRAKRIQEAPTVNYRYDPAAVILDNIIRQIYDWYQATNPEISSYDFNTARAAYDQWHTQIALEGEGREYDGSQTDVYTYSNGWKMVQIHSDNDLQVEGNLMHHCVGSYCEDVSAGSAIILSLREPHVTIEMDPSGGIEQLQGNSNSTPKSEYQQIICQFWNTPEAQQWLA